MVGDFDFKMSPFVVIRVGKLKEWLSLVCVNGGSKPQWLNQYFDVSVKDKTQEIKIDVHDLRTGQTPMLATVKMTLGYLLA